MKKLSLFLFLVFCLSCITMAQEPAAKKKNRKKQDQSAQPAAEKEKVADAVAPKLPPPEKGTCIAIEMDEKRSALAGKIVKIKFNRITSLQKIPKGQMYVGNLGSSEKSDDITYYDHPGIDVILPKEGLGFLSKFIPKFGSQHDDVSYLIKPDLGEVYVQVGRNAKEPSIAVGDRYEQDGDEGTYKWSTDTEVPDLTTKDKVSVDDVLLFPEQLNGKTIAMEFYVVGKVPKKSVEESPAYVSCGMGHAYVQIAFPPEGKEFFKTIADQKNFPKANTVYAVVTVSRAGVVTLEAKGRRASGSGDEVTYKW